MSSSEVDLKAALAKRNQALAYSDDSDVEEYEDEGNNSLNNLSRSYHGALQQADLLTQSFYGGQPALPDNADFQSLVEQTLEIFNYDFYLIEDLMLQLEDLIRTNPNRQKALNELKAKVIKMFELSRSEGIKSITDKITFPGDLIVNNGEVNFFKEIYFAIERMSHIKEPKVTSTLALGAELGKAAHRVYLFHRNEKKNEKKEKNVAYLNKDLKRLLFLEAKISEVPKSGFLTFVKKNKNFSTDELKKWALERVCIMVAFIEKDIAILEEKISKTRNILEPLAKLDGKFHKLPLEVDKARKSLGILDQYSKELLELKQRLLTIEGKVESQLVLPKDINADVEETQVREVHKKNGQGMFAALTSGQPFSLKKTTSPHKVSLSSQNDASPSPQGKEDEKKPTEKLSSSLEIPLELSKPAEDNEVLVENNGRNDEEAVVIKNTFMPTPLRAEIVKGIPTRIIVRESLSPETLDYIKQKLEEVKRSFEERLAELRQALSDEQERHAELSAQLELEGENTRQATENLVQREQVIEVLQRDLGAQAESIRQVREQYRHVEQQLAQEQAGRAVLLQQIEGMEQDRVPALQAQLAMQEQQAVREVEELRQEAERQRAQAEQALLLSAHALAEVEEQLRVERENTRAVNERSVERERALGEQLQQLQLTAEHERVQADQVLQMRTQGLAEQIAANAALQQENQQLQVQLAEMQAALQAQAALLAAAPPPAPVLPAAEPAGLPIVEPAAPPALELQPVAEPLAVEVVMPGLVEQQPAQLQQPAQPEPVPALAPIVAFHPGNPAVAPVVPAPVQEVMQQEQPWQEAVPVAVPVATVSVLITAQKRRR